MEFVGQGEFPLRFAWTYNSQGAAATAVPYGDIVGGLRQTTFSRSVTVSTNGSRAFVSRPDGNSIEFVLSGMVWAPATGERGSLQQTAAAGEAWIYSDLSNNKDYFDSSGKLTAMSNASGRRISVVYGAGGRIDSASDDAGRTLVFLYDGNGRLQTLGLPDGGSLGFTYDASGYLDTVTYPGGNSLSYRYDESGWDAGSVAGSLTGVIDEEGVRYSSTIYDTSSVALATQRAGGVDLEQGVYTPSSSSGAMSKVVVTTANGAAREVGIGVRNGKVLPLWSTASCSGCKTKSDTYLYDSNGFEDIVIRDGVATDSNYSAGGLLLQKVEVAFNTTGSKRTNQTDWHSTLPVPVEHRTYDATNTLVAKRTYTYNTRGQVLTASTIDPATSATRTTTLAYCEQADVTAGTCPLIGLVTTVDGSRTDVNDVTVYAYYPSDASSCGTSPTTCPHRKGDLWLVQDAAGNITETLAYDGAGRVLSVKDANNVITDFEYHPRGWLTARKVRGTDNASETDDQITRIDYYPTGLVQKTTLPDGSYTAYTYDAAHRLTDITDGAGNTIHYTLDNAGNRTKEDTKDSTGALARTLSRVYNQLGQVQAQKDAYNHATGFAYDANGNTDTVTDALSRVIDNDYDPLNRLSKTIQNVGGLNVTTQFQYDARDNLTAVIDPKGLTTGYTYNGLGDLTQLSSPDTGVTTYTYDSAGNRKTQTDARNVTATYGYDALNRLTSISYPDSSLNVSYAYDTATTACATGEAFAAGRLGQMTDASGSTQYCYDRFGQLVRKVQTTAGQSLTVRYAYTKAGQLSSITYPDGSVADYVRDGLGRTTEVGVTRPGGTREILLTAASYYPFGPASEWVFGNGRLFQRTLNQNYQPGVVQDQDADGLSLGYEFDAVGNLAKLRNGNQNDPPLRIFSYNALNRLTSAQDGTTQAFTERYDYDATGNRISTSKGNYGTSYTIASNSHRLTAVGGVARTYDNAGNTTSIGGGAREFTYSDANRMSAVQQGGTTAMSYAYNGKGEQVRRSNGSTQVVTAYDEAGHWLGEYDSAGVPSQQVIWLDDLPVGLIVGTAAANQPLHYIEADALGTPRTIIESQRNVAVWSWPLTGEAFGTDQPIEDADGDGTALSFALRFPGQRYDAATGLNQNYFRDYEPGTGGYTESDPIGLNGGLSTYAYSGGSPLTQADPLGLDWIEYTGRQMSLYGGKLGNRSQLKRRCSASSGRNNPGVFDYRNSAYQNVGGWGPTPEGLYRVNLVPDPNRIAKANRNGNLVPSPQGGIERIPGGGTRDWGTWRARLQAVPGTNIYTRDGLFYLHDSSKGETHGCIETCGGLLDSLLQLRQAGVETIDVFVDYPGFIPTRGY